jgi:hypothetical protein
MIGSLQPRQGERSMKRTKMKRVAVDVTVTGWVSSRIVAQFPMDADDDDITEAVKKSWPNGAFDVFDDQIDSDCDIEPAKRSDVLDARYERKEDGSLRLTWKLDSAD